MEGTPPSSTLSRVKRSDALAPLSRDHHAALEVALRMRRADDASAAATATRFLEFMHRHGEAHFAAEERELLPLARPDHAERTRSEHTDIRKRAAALRDAGDAVGRDAVRAAGDALHAHVRFEERELFEDLERRLSRAELQALGERLETA